MASGFEHYETPVLLTTYANLLRGLDRVAKVLDVTEEHNRVPVPGDSQRVVHVGCCKFDETPDTKGGVPPSQFGVQGLWMLQSVATELLSRGVPLPKSKEPS